MKDVVLAEILVLLFLGLLFARTHGEQERLDQEISRAEMQLEEEQQKTEQAKKDAEAARQEENLPTENPLEEAAPAEEEEPGAEESEEPQTEAQEDPEQENVPEQTEEAQEAQALLERMTVEEKVSQLFYITPDALSGVEGTTRAGDILRQAYEQYPVGGLVFFRNNLSGEDQIREMTAALKEIGEERIGAAPFLGVDEEGGTVTRVAGTEGFPVSDVGNMCLIGETGDPELALEAGSTIGAYLSDYGFTMDFAPDADVLVNPENTVVKRRSFGSDPEMTAQMTAAAAEGLQSQGVMAVLKHFPGHGATSEDSHEGFAYSERTLDELRQCEFLPFRAGIDAGVRVVMVGHISLPQAAGDSSPATLSETVIGGMLRQELGFDGIVITDAMNMGAIAENYSSGDAAVRAILAGVDMLLMPADFHSAWQAVVDAVNNGTISMERLDESVLRILTVKTGEW